MNAEVLPIFLFTIILYHISSSKSSFFVRNISQKFYVFCIFLTYMSDSLFISTITISDFEPVLKGIAQPEIPLVTMKSELPRFS